MLNKQDALSAWKAILNGRKPLLSIELTKECPLRCAGCYAYEDQHLGGGTTLRQLSDFKGDELVRRFLALLDELQPLHVSIVGGDPMVRFRELQSLLPQIAARGIFIQLVTSAFRPIPREWAAFGRFKLVVSIDGLQPEHDERRKPATYERILKNIVGHNVTVHCTLTSMMLERPSYIEQFLQFWSEKEETRYVWFSLFTPQVGAENAETPSVAQRQFAVAEMLRLLPRYPKLDMSARMIRQFAAPPHSPEACLFAQATETISADLVTRVTPCQLGGNPDCSRCGCVASMGLNALAEKSFAGVPIGKIFHVSNAVGGAVRRLRAA
jgi:sulfatase maturation enzyme AslB (radical SAM superfamily)